MRICTIRIEMESAAFRRGEVMQLSSVVTRAAATILNNHTLGKKVTLTLKDSDGVTVGTLKIGEEAQ